MANLAYTHFTDLGFDVSGNFTTAAFDTSADTWGVLILGALASSTWGTITSATYGGVDITAHTAVNSGTVHVNATILGFYAFKLGANAGNNTFNVQWSGGGAFFAVAVGGSGDIDAAVLDGTPASSTETVGTTFTPDPYTPVTNNALPLFLTLSNNYAGGGGNFSANANCTLIYNNTTLWGTFYGPLSTPAGTATSAVMDDSNFEFQQTLSWALKPAASGNTDTTWIVRQQRPVANFFPTIVHVP